MIANFLLLLFLSFGLGGFFPNLNKNNQFDLGVRLLGGYALLVCLLYVAIVLLGIGFSLNLYILIPLASVGGFVLARRVFLQFPMHMFLFHPVLVLPAMIVGAALVYAPIHFVPYGDDTFTNWLTHAKQLWLIDGYHDERIYSGARGYLPGWHFLLGFTSPLWGEFSETRAIAAPTVMHVALIVAAYDVLTTWAKAHKLDNWHAQLFGYLVILLLLTAEASWLLVPVLILSEMPLFYSLIGVFIVGSFFYSERPRIIPVAFVLSLVLCAHYLIKSQGLATIPIALALGFTGSLYSSSFNQRGVLKALGVSLLILTPVFLVAASWDILGPQSTKCIANAGSFLGKGLSQIAASSQWQNLFRDIAGFMGLYLLSYKTVLTLAGLAGVISALFDRKLQCLSLALIAYIVIYCIAVYWTYTSCPNGFNSYLSSLPRYLQLPIRLLHFIGPMMLAMVCLKFAVRFLGNALPRPLKRLVYIGIGILATYQILMIKKSYAILQSPDMGKMEFYANTTLTQTEALLKVARAHGFDNPKVLLIHDFHEFFPYLLAGHYGLKKSPHDVNENAPLSRFRLEHLQLDKIKKGPTRTTDYYLPYDVLWPRDGSKLISNEINKLTDNANCVENPDKYFLTRSDRGLTPFVCVLKSDYN